MFQPSHHLISVAHSPLPLASPFGDANPRTASWAELERQATFGAEVRRARRARRARKAARSTRAHAFSPSLAPAAPAVALTR